MIKCIATDMDGTLLNSIQQVSQENKEAILKAQAQGIEVVVATGRSYQEATYALNEAGLNCPVIGVNGAEVRTKEGDVISAISIDKQIAKGVAKKLQENEVYFEVYTNDGAYTIDGDKAVSIIVDIILSANPDVNMQEAVTAAEKRVHEGRIHLIDNYDVLFNDEDAQVYKFLAFSFDSKRLEAASNELADFKELTVTTSGHENLEITHKDAQKGIALEAFVKTNGIDLSETMAIGDNFNDVSMFERGGRAVAMGNAGFTIKSLCDVVTDTNDENGVAKAILEVL
ncbi:Cof-type HAD-IIB family hydrolase [Neobacillus pocheonensis]|uniref:Cof-type HAD-IIB family hydrolase n=1 Tax=Neobacillus pocheonensis TaxID=363869 RepID=A0ABT0WH91_9BACI|nr:Cof-type HAD-IIB family hydrolase [Neobacillus pocheonensis]